MKTVNVVLRNGLLSEGDAVPFSYLHTKESHFGLIATKQILTRSLQSFSIFANCSGGSWLNY